MLKLSRIENELGIKLTEVIPGNYSGMKGNIMLSITEETCFIQNVANGKSDTLYNTNDLDSIVRSVGDLA